MDPETRETNQAARFHGGAPEVRTLAAGGEPLQLTNDPVTKIVNAFSPDGTQIYFTDVFPRGEIRSVPTLGGASTVSLPATAWRFLPTGIPFISSISSVCLLAIREPTDAKPGFIKSPGHEPGRT